MAGSPFAGKGGAATANKPAAAPAAGPTPPARPTPPRTPSRQVDPDDLSDATSAGDDSGSPISSDPYNAPAVDPGGVSGLKPIAFMGQLVLLHCSEVGRMKTSTQSQDEDGKSGFAKFDLIPLTVPEAGVPTVRTEAVLNDEGEVAVLNKDGDVETFEYYEPDVRIDDLLFFNKPLVREGKRMLDRGHNWILGRITLGEKKPGQSPPVIIQAGTDEDKAYYAAWLAAKKAGK